MGKGRGTSAYDTDSAESEVPEQFAELFHEFEAEHKQCLEFLATVAVPTDESGEDDPRLRRASIFRSQLADAVGELRTQLNCCKSANAVCTRIKQATSALQAQRASLLSLCS